jgi:S1-C subfamily serine protease
MHRISSLAIAASLALFGTAAAGDRAVTLGGEAALSDALADRLPAGVERVGTGISSTPATQTWTTDEGTTLAWSDLLKDGSVKDSRAAQRLRKEYRADLLALAWVTKDEVKEFKAYGLKKRILEIQVRLVAAETGRVLFRKTLKHTSKFASDEDRSDALAEVFSKWSPTKAKAQFAKALDGFQPGAATGTVKLVVRPLTQAEYFQHRGRYLGLALLAGGKGKVWDEYDRTSKAMTIRVAKASSFDTYYRNLYHAVLVEEGFVAETFDLRSAEDGTTIELLRLPASTRRLVVFGLTPAQFHDKLAVYQSAVAAMDGTGEVKAQFIAGTTRRDPRLVVSFTYRGDLTAFEATLWASLKKGAQVPNRELVSIAGSAIVYRAGVGATEPRPLEVHFRNVGIELNKRIGGAIQSLVQGIGGDALTKTYDPARLRLTYRLNSPLSALDAEAKLWKAIQAAKPLADLAPDASRGRTVGFVYLEPKVAPPPRRMVIELQELSPQGVEDAGRVFVELLKSIPGVADLKHTYDEGTGVLKITFGFSGDTLYPVDSAIWTHARKLNGLKALALSSITADRAEYFLSGGRGASKRDPGLVVVLKTVGPQAQKFVATGFTALLDSLPGVRAVRAHYTARLRTATFQFAYTEDAAGFPMILDKALAAAASFKHVARGPSLGNRFEYFYYDHELTEPQVPSGSPAPTEVPTASAGGLAGLVESLDASVVIVFFKDGASSGHGTGFFVSKRGYVLTNAHVVPGGALSVQTYDGRRYGAQLVKKDNDLDLALLKLKHPRQDWPAVPIGDSGALKRGQPLLVIGTPLREEYDHSVATGILAGRDRHRGLIQITIPTYPGNSGSPLFDYQGNAVGVVVSVAMARKKQLVVEGNTVRETEANEAVENIGFAIPIQFAKPLLSLAE